MGQEIQDSGMPGEIKEIFILLDEEMTWLRIRWQYHKQLFEAGELRLRLLEESASTFFVDLSRIMLDELIIGISRFTDHSGSGQRTNATVCRLADAIDNAVGGEFALEFRQHLDEVRSICEPLRQHRDKRIAHRDFRRASEPGSFPRVDTNTIEDILDRLGHLLNDCETHFTKSATIYDFVVVSHGADVLVETLKGASAFRDLQTEDTSQWYQRLLMNRFNAA